MNKMNTVVAKIENEKYKTSITAGNHKMIVDEPLDMGGLDLGFQPLELLAASLASCTAITLRMYIDRKDWQISHIQVAVDIEPSEDKSQTKYIRRISYEGILDSKNEQRLHAIANACPIHKILLSQVNVETIISN